MAARKYEISLGVLKNISRVSAANEWNIGKRKFVRAFHLVKISGISGSAVNGTRFVGSSHWKIPRKSGKSKKVGPFSRLEFPNGMSCSIYVSRSLYQFQVHGRAPPRTGVYDQMEQLFTNRKFHFCYHRNFRVFFLNRKRPVSPSDHVIFYLLYKHQWNAKPVYLKSFLVWMVRFIMKP